jgi:hypothetical protein
VIRTETGLRGQSNRANYDAIKRRQTVSNFDFVKLDLDRKKARVSAVLSNSKLGRKKVGFGRISAVVSAVRSQIFVQLGQPKFSAVINVIVI